MSRLEDAQKRLDRALARIDAAVAQKKARSEGDSAEMARALEAERRRAEALETREREIGKRLDSAIGRLRAVLES